MLSENSFKTEVPGNITSQGYCFNGSNLLCDNEIAELFTQVVDFKAFWLINSQINGIYSIYIRVTNEIWLYVSPGGFHKLYYSKTDSGYTISKRAGDLFDGHLDEESILEYRSSLFCWGNKTLYKNVFSVEPGNAVLVAESFIETKKLFSYAVNASEIFTQSFEQLKLNGKKVFDNVTDRMISFLGGRQAVVPLSGGYDSRFVLSALVSKGYRNIVAVTYGIKEVPEFTNAQKVALKLGITWYFIPYTEDMLNELLQSFDLDSYFDYMVNGNSFPSMHEMIALSYLKSNRLIELNAVFIPGHSGDMLGGSQYIKAFETNLKYNQISLQLLNKKFDPSFYSKSDFLKKKLEISALVEKSYPSDLVPTTIYEDIDMSEKLSKHILNSSNAYVYYGYSCYFPYWDKELIEFFRHVPVTFKMEKRLYNTILKEYFFDKLSISFEQELHPSLFKMKAQNIKNQIKKFLPKKILYHFTRKNDYYLYHQITSKWREEMEKKGFITKGTHFNYNSLIAQWVIYKMKNQVNFSE